MKTIILYGELAKRFGKYHKFAVKNAAEAIRALKANFEGFEAYLCGAHLQQVGFRLFVGGASIKEYSEIHNPSGGSDVIRIVPVIVGSKSGWVQILIGVALIAAAVVITAGTLGTGAPLAAQILGSLGAGLVIGGVANLLTSPPSALSAGGGSDNTKNSYIFSGPENVAVQGRAVPIGYGRMMVGSVVVSAGMETHEQ